TRKKTLFTNEVDRILLASTTAQWPKDHWSRAELPSFEAAGPRSQLYFNPENTVCGLVTCGGLCPGLNDVIRPVVLTLHHHYGVRRVLGFRFGYAGLASPESLDPIELNPFNVQGIHDTGGTILGSSRGPQDPESMLDTLLRRKVSILFAIGGDGT